MAASLLIYSWKFCTTEKKAQMLLAKDELSIVSLLDNFHLLSLDCFQAMVSAQLVDWFTATVPFGTFQNIKSQ